MSERERIRARAKGFLMVEVLPELARRFFWRLSLSEAIQNLLKATFYSLGICHIVKYTYQQLCGMICAYTARAITWGALVQAHQALANEDKVDS